MAKEICPNCEKICDVELHKEGEELIVRGESITVPVEYYKCSECGADFEDPRSTYDPLMVAYEEYRRRHKMMQPEEIRLLRRQYGLTQKDLSRLLGWGDVTLTRYENGALQDKTHDTVLQMIRDPKNVLELIERNGGFLGEERRKRLTGLLKKAQKESQSVSVFLAEYFGQYKPDVLSGFRRIDLTKLYQAIVFFCIGGTLKTKLNKLLFYADFKHFKEFSVSITGVQYVRLPHGPVPDNYEFYLAALQGKEGPIQLHEEQMGPYIGEVFYASVSPDLLVFSDTELKVLSEVKKHFENYNASQIRDYSHKEKAYKETSDGQFITYEYANDLRI